MSQRPEPQRPPQQPPPQQPPPGWTPQVWTPPAHPQATTTLVLGILGLVVCGVAAPFAWSIGRRTLREIDASRGSLGGRDTAQIGYVLGIVGSVLLGLGIAVLVLMVVFFGLFGLAATTVTGTG